MHSSRSGRSAIFFLQGRIIVNWFRRSMRSPFFWLVAAFLLFMLFLQIAAIVDGPEEADFAADLDPAYFNAIAAIVLLGGILVGLWRGTTNTPGASLADIVVMMLSPVSRRLQYGLLMARSSFQNALIIGLWSIAAASWIIMGIDDPWISLRLLFSVVALILLSEFLRYAVWVGTEQVVARSPRFGMRLRLLTRIGVAVAAITAGAYLLWPLLDGSIAEWRDALDVLIERGDGLAAIPPMSIAASVFNPAGASFLSALGLTVIITGVAVLALYWARDFVEPVSVNAERKTDARGQMLEAGSDVQWAALAQFGIAPRLRVTIPTFGGGAWALLWGSLTRWLRYQAAAAWNTILILGIFGGLTALGVRLGIAPVEVAWGVALMFPFFGSVGMFMDELRRQFLFLIPGSTRARLTAAALTSVLDGLVSCLVVIVVMTALGVVPIVHAAGLLLLGMSIALLGQSSLALAQVLLPFWVGQRIRVTVTFGITGLGFLPGLMALVGFYIAISPTAGLLVAAGITTVVGLLVLVIAGLRFDRIEHSG